MNYKLIILTPRPLNAGIKKIPSESSTDFAISDDKDGCVNKPNYKKSDKITLIN